MTADSQPDKGSACWAATVSDGICEVIEIERPVCFETEEAAVSYALEYAVHRMGYWERQTDLLRRRLHEIATRGEDV